MSLAHKRCAALLSAGYLLLAVSTALAADASNADRAWMSWRGPRDTGVAPRGKPPTEWSEEKNVRWKVAIPGHGHSTPIVYRDLVIIQAAIPMAAPETTPSADTEGASGPQQQQERPRAERRRGRRGRRRNPAPDKPYRFTLMAFDRDSGDQRWKTVLRKQIPHEGSHRDGSLAPASPITDGEHIYACFGSRGLYCVTFDGKQVWEKDLGDMQTRNGFGEGASPVLHGDTLLMTWDHEGASFIVALDKRTGKEQWRRPRDEPTSWATPLIVTDQGRAQAIVPGSNRVRSYDIASGDLIWECAGLGLNCAPTPVAADGVVYAMTGYRDPMLLAIRYGGQRGDITASAIVWSTDEGTSYVPSPLLYDDTLYFLRRNNGILSCVNPKTGKRHYEPQRLTDVPGIYASPVGADGRVYIVGRNGKTLVLKRGPQFEVLATNQLDDEFTASPAIVDDALFLRGAKNLYCIAR